MALRSSLPGNLNSRVDELKADIAALSEDLRRRASAPASNAAAAGSSLLGSLGLASLLPVAEDLLRTVQNAGGGIARDARDRSGEAYRAVERTVEHNPMPAVATALAVGFLLGWMSRSSR